MASTYPIGQRCLFVALGAFLSLASDPVLAQSPAAQRGLTFVRVHCAQCHAIDKVSESPLAIVPPFRTLHQRFPIESLRRRFAEGIMTTRRLGIWVSVWPVSLLVLSQILEKKMQG